LVNPQTMVNLQVQREEEQQPQSRHRIPDFTVLAYKRESETRVILLLIENKARPILKGNKSAARALKGIGREEKVIKQIRNAAKFATRGKRTVISILTAGEFWCYTAFDGRTLSGVELDDKESSASMEAQFIWWSEMFTAGTPESEAQLEMLLNLSAERNGWYVLIIFIMRQLMQGSSFSK